MPFTAINRTVLSDLVVHEQDPSVGYARRVITVRAEDPLTIGTVVFRVKNANANAPYAPVEDGDDLSLSNEYAVVFGDIYSCREQWEVTDDATTPNSVAFVKGTVILKDKLITETTGFAFGTASYLQLKGLLEAQGIVIEQTI